jgi:hypothetical protein
VDELIPICLYCSKLVHCPLLSDSGGKCVEERLITAERYRECPDWTPIQYAKKKVRDKMYNISGLGYLRCAHSEFPDQETSLTLDEGALYAMIMERERPDFYSMLYEGITTTERDTQLRFQTDENGQIKVVVGPDGTEIPLVRPNYELMGYAMAPEGPICAGRNVMFSSVNEIIEHILKTEVAAGLVIKAKKPKAETPQPEERETVDMPPAKGTPVQTRVVTNRPGPSVAPTPGNVRPPAQAAAPGPRRANPKPPAGAPAQAAAPAPASLPKPKPVQTSGPAVGGRVSNPVRRPGPQPQPQVQEQQAPEEVAAQSAIDLEGLAVMTANVMEAKTAAQIEALRGELLGAIDHAKSQLADMLAIAFDMAVQTNGTYQYAQMDDKNNYVVDDQGNPVMVSLPQISRKKGRLLSFADQSAYTAPDEEGQAQGE